MGPDPRPGEWTRGEYRVSTDRSRIDPAVVHGFLVHTFWGKGLLEEAVRRSVDHSLPFGLFRGDRLIGFARVVTDYVNLAYLADVVVLEEFRGRGLGRWLVECVLAHPELQGLRRWLLSTLDAHGLYRQLGFTELARPELLMERPGGGTFAEIPRAGEVEMGGEAACQMHNLMDPDPE
ncbi:MAG TPA: GNAT family N-acetyltransferase [Longimicrobiaceae bacterium]|nr:GNAT family N-acetyltransferase [Longimicrobiaceae bacterium]